MKAIPTAVLALLVSSFSLISCGSFQPVANYSIGAEMSANVGDAIASVTRREGTYGEVIFSQQLIYAGHQGTTIFVTYREFANNMARPAFTQELRYDVAGNHVIRFRQMEIRVISYDPSSVRYIIEKDGGMLAEAQAASKPYEPPRPDGRTGR